MSARIYKFCKNPGKLLWSGYLIWSGVLSVGLRRRRALGPRPVSLSPGSCSPQSTVTSPTPPPLRRVGVEAKMVEHPLDRCTNGRRGLHFGKGNSPDPRRRLAVSLGSFVGWHRAGAVTDRQWHTVSAVFGGGWWGCEATDELGSKFLNILHPLCASCSSSSSCSTRIS